MKKTLLAAAVASSLIVPAQAGVYIPPKPAIVKPENIDFSKHMLLGMPMTMGMLAARGNSPSYVYCTQTSSATNLTSYTFTAVPISTASAYRRVLVLINGTGSASGRTLSSVTIGGVTATSHVINVSSSTYSSRMVSALVPTGTTADIVITYSGSMNDCSIGVWALYNVASTPRLTAKPNTTTYNYTLNLIPNDITILAQWDTSTAITWTNATRDFNAIGGSGENYSGASYQSTTTQTRVIADSLGDYSYAVASVWNS